MRPCRSARSVTVQATFSAARDDDAMCCPCESRNSPTHGSYMYYSRCRRQPTAESRGGQDDYYCGCLRRTHARGPDSPYSDHHHRRYEEDSPPCRPRSPALRSCGGDRVAVLRVLDNCFEPNERYPFHHSQRPHGGGPTSEYSISASVYATAEDVLACLVSDSVAQQVHVHWRSGESEPLRTSISVAVLASDAVYLEIRKRHSRRCHCCH